MKKEIIDTGLHYPISLQELPQKWLADHLSAFTELIESGFACGSHNQTGEGVQHLRPMNITNMGEIDLSDARHVPINFNSKRIQENDVLFNNTNSPALIGKTAHVGHAASGKAFSNHMTRILFKTGVDPRFAARQLNFLFSTGYFLHRCVKHVNQASISSRDLGRSIPFIVPPLAEQKRIVGKIEELFSELDAGEESLRHARRQLSLYRQSLLKQAFEGKLTGKSKAWTSIPLRDLGQWQGGGTPSKANKAYWENGTIPWVSPKDMKVRRIETAQDKITPKAVDESACNIIAPFSILLVTRSGILAHSLPVGINLKRVAINQDLKAITPNKECDPNYLWYFFKSHEHIILNTCRKGGTTVHSIEFPALKEVIVPLPALPEQREIVRILDEQFAVMEENERELDAALARSAALRQSILRHAFTGKLVPQDPTDEPASELLARIREKRKL